MIDKPIFVFVGVNLLRFAAQCHRRVFDVSIGNDQAIFRYLAIRA